MKWIEKYNSNGRQYWESEDTKYRILKFLEIYTVYINLAYANTQSWSPSQDFPTMEDARWWVEKHTDLGNTTLTIQVKSIPVARSFRKIEL
jgi:hypothetical protein